MSHDCHFCHLTVAGSEAATRGVLWKKVFLEISKFTGKHLCQCLFFNKVAGLRPVTGGFDTGVILWVSKNTFFYRTTLVAASAGSEVALMSHGFFWQKILLFD